MPDRCPSCSLPLAPIPGLANTIQQCEACKTARVYMPAGNPSYGYGYVVMPLDVFWRLHEAVEKREADAD